MSTSHTIRAHAQEINRTKIKGGCQSEIRVVIHNSKIDLPLIHFDFRSYGYKDAIITIPCVMKSVNVENCENWA